MSTGTGPLPRKRVMIVDVNTSNNGTLLQWFKSQPDFEIMDVFTSPLMALQFLRKGLPDVALIGIDIPNGVKFCQLLRQKNPSIAIIAISSLSRDQLEEQARVAGALDSLTRGAELSAIGQVVRKATSIETTGMCSIVGIGGIKAGVGTTLFTCLLADFFGRRLAGKVLVIDLHRHRGDIAFNLGMSSNQNLFSLLQQNEFLHPTVFQNFIKRNVRGFSLLASDQDIHEDPINELGLFSLLTVLGNFFELILLDMPPYPFEGFDQVVDACDNIILNIGETSNQLKLAFQMADRDLSALPESLTRRMHFVSWTQDTGAQTGVLGLLPDTVFIPKPKEAMFSNPNFTINDAPEFIPLRKAIADLVERIPALCLHSVDVKVQDSGGKKSMWDVIGGWFTG